MYPVAIARVGATIGPYLGRIATRDAALVPSLIAKLRAGGGFVGNKIGDIVSFVKNSPVNAMLVLTSLASLGYSAAELLNGDDKEVKDFARQLEDAAMAAAGMIDEVGRKSETLDVVDESPKGMVNADVVISVLSWARSHYGTVEKAIEAHRMNQAFMEMPLADVREGYRVYKLR